MIMLCMPVCPHYLSLTVSSAWRTQLDNECGTAPAQRDRPLRCPTPDHHQRAFLHVRYTPHLEIAANPRLSVALTSCVEIRVRQMRLPRGLRDCQQARRHAHLPGGTPCSLRKVVNQPPHNDTDGASGADDPYVKIPVHRGHTSRNERPEQAGPTRQLEKAKWRGPLNGPEKWLLRERRVVRVRSR